MTATDTFSYDGDCGLCARTVEWLAERTDDSVRFTPAGGQGADDPSPARHAAALVDATGRRWEGSDAVGEVLRRSPRYDNNLLGRLLLEWPSRPIAAWVYGWVARNHHRLDETSRDRAQIHPSA